MSTARLAATTPRVAATRSNLPCIACTPTWNGSLRCKGAPPANRATRQPADEIRTRVYGPLEADHPELARTLDVLVEHDFEKGRVAAALPVHRNTLRDRVARISELTGVDLERADGRGMAWLAWLARRDWTPRPEIWPG
jgi:PucR C-terminal helix-turn-helix domain